MQAGRQAGGEGIGKCAGNWHGSRRVVVNLRCAANEPKQCENIETGREGEGERGRSAAIEQTYRITNHSIQQ